MIDMPVFEKCRLCLNERDLKRSHLLPKALYRLVRMAQGQQSQQLVVGTHDAVTYSDSQIWAHMLCGECEGRFSKAESWALWHCSRGRGVFRLLDMVQTAGILAKTGGTRVVAAAAIPGFDAELLGYFALSVFWRCSARAWHNQGTDIRIELGPYEERLRQYLLGEAPPPENMFLHVEVVDRRDPLHIATTPAVKNKGRFRYFDFRIPGLRFRLYVGKEVPHEIRESCFLRAHERYLFVRMAEDIRPLQKLMSRAKLSERLLREEHERACGGTQ